MTTEPFTARRLAEHLAARLDRGEPTWLASLVERDGHGYYGPGAHVLVEPGIDVPRALAGRISGGCLEDEVAARLAGRGVSPRIIEVDTSDESPFGLGLGCGGRLRVLAEPVDPAGPDVAAWRAWCDAIAAGSPVGRWLDEAGTWAWTIDGTVRFAHESASDGDAEASRRGRVRDLPRAEPARDVHARIRRVRDGWRESIPSPPRLRVIGVEDDGTAVARTMLHHGWDVELLGPARRRVEVAAERLAQATGRTPAVRIVGPDALADVAFDADDRVLAASRRLDLDAAVIAAALRSGVRWCGAVASRARREALFRTDPLATWIEQRPETAARLEAPVAAGMPAEGAEEVATAVAARLVSDLRAATRPVWAVIPAAGASRRLGTPKPLLSDGRETLIDRAERLTEAFCDGTLVVTGRAARDVEARLGPGSRVVRLAGPENGLSASLHEGIRALPASARVLVHLPDMPTVDVDHLTALVRDGSSGTGAASQRVDGGIGAPALLPDTLVAAVRAGETVARGDAGFAAYLRSSEGITPVRLDDATDVDEPHTAGSLGWVPES